MSKPDKPVKSKLDSALEIARRGLPVFPLQYTLPNGNCSCGDASCESAGKHPLRGSNGYKDATTDEAQIRQWWTESPDSNIAIHPGAKYVYVDLDVTKGRDGYKSLAEYLGIEKSALQNLTYSVRTPSGGLHLYFKVDKAHGNRTGVLPGVDIRGQGGHVVAESSSIWRKDEFGVFFEVPYTVANDSAVAKMPEEIGRLLRELKERDLQAHRSIIEGATDHPASIAQVRKVLKTRKPAIEGQGGDEHTLVTIYLCRDYDLSPEGTFALLTEDGGWNDRCEPYWTANELWQKIDNAYKYAKGRPGSKGGATVEIAEELGFIPDDWIQDSVLPKNFFDDDKKEKNMEDFAGFDGHLFRANKFLAEDLHYDFIVDGWLPDQGFTAMLAKREGGKTTVIMDMVCHIALDREWRGTSVDKGWTVVYIAGEDEAGVKGRLEAWCLKNLGKGELPDEERLLIFDMGIDLMDREQVEKFTRYIQRETEKFTKVMFVVDTWQRMTAMAEGGQSADKDMQKAVKNLEDMCKKFKGPSIIAAHPPKHDAKTISGSAAIENSSHAIIHIGDPMAGEREARVIRIKGAPAQSYKKFRLVSQDIKGFTRTGKQRNAVVAEYAGGMQASDFSAPKDTIPVKKQLVPLVAEIIVKIGEFSEDFDKSYVAVSDIAKVAYQLFNEQPQPGGKWGAKWRQDFIDMGFPEHELKTDKVFQARDSNVYKMLERIRAESNGAVIIEGDKWLVWKMHNKTIPILDFETRKTDAPPDPYFEDGLDEGIEDEDYTPATDSPATIQGETLQ